MQFLLGKLSPHRKAYRRGSMRSVRKSVYTYLYASSVRGLRTSTAYSICKVHIAQTALYNVYPVHYTRIQCSFFSEGNRGSNTVYFAYGSTRALLYFRARYCIFAENIHVALLYKFQLFLSTHFLVIFTRQNHGFRFLENAEN